MCGVCGIWSPAGGDPTEAARLTFFALYALQHRGQESAGIAATDGRDLRVVRRMGLVGQVFAEPDLAVFFFLKDAPSSRMAWARRHGVARLRATMLTTNSPTSPVRNCWNSFCRTATEV